MQDFVRQWKTGKAEKSAHLTFASPELLWKILTAKRWDLLKAMRGAGPMSIREAARRVGRDVKASERCGSRRQLEVSNRILLAVDQQFDPVCARVMFACRQFGQLDDDAEWR